MPPADQSQDPGLQQERTVLAWDRTGLSLVVASGLLARSLGEPLVRPVSLIPLAGVVFGLVVLILDRPRYVARWRTMHTGHGMLSPGPILTVALATVVLGVSSLVVVLA